MHLDWDVDEGAEAPADQRLFTVPGPARALLTGERTALNFLQLLSATATAAHRYAAAHRGHRHAALLDTRKTLPGLRTAQKYAVRVGGGQQSPHRPVRRNPHQGKPHHGRRIDRARRWPRRAPPRRIPIEVEVEDLAELQQAIDARRRHRAAR